MTRGNPTRNHPLDYSGKVALITGAAGMGLATARAFADANFVLAGLEVEAVEEEAANLVSR